MEKVARGSDTRCTWRNEEREAVGQEAGEPRKEEGEVRDFGGRNRGDQKRSERDKEGKRAQRREGAGEREGARRRGGRDGVAGAVGEIALKSRSDSVRGGRASHQGDAV